MIRLYASSTKAWARTDAPLTTGSVGVPCKVELSDDFDDLASVICFRAGDSAFDVPSDDEVIVPHECLVEVGDTLQIGVYASLPDGTIVVPTVWANVGEIREGVEPSEVDPSEPTPSWAAQVQLIAQNAESVAETAETIAQSVREDADAGAFVGPQGPKGDTGDTGPTGPKGDSYVLTSADKAEIADIVLGELPTETWTFTLADGTTVTRTVVIA